MKEVKLLEMNENVASPVALHANILSGATEIVGGEPRH
jgi:hypothetical protein